MPEHFKKWLDFLLIILLLFIASFLRFEFQACSVVDLPIRADSGGYYAVAHNLYFYSVYSSQLPNKESRPPETDFLRPPGYPLFLYLFMLNSDSRGDFLTEVTMCQALLGTIVVVLVFGIGRHLFSSAYAFGAGLLTALSPHLIAIDKYLLSESIFVLGMVLSVFVLVAAVKRNNRWLFLLSGMLLGYLVLIRPVALLLGPFLAFSLALYLWHIWLPRQLLVMALLIITGYTLVYAPYLVVRNQVAKKFSLTGETLWDKIVIGSDIGLKNFIVNKEVAECKAEAAKMYTDKRYALKKMFERFSQDPIGHLKWYLTGKTLFLWRWDNIYFGDVYQYSMYKKGFEVSSVLKRVHTLMLWLHWPLAALTLCGMILLAWERLSRSNLTDSHAVAVPFLVIIYFVIIFAVLVPLPRYGIPLRPFSYLLAIFVVKTTVEKLFINVDVSGNYSAKNVDF